MARRRELEAMPLRSLNSTLGSIEMVRTAPRRARHERLIEPAAGEVQPDRGYGNPAEAGGGTGGQVGVGCA